MGTAGSAGVYVLCTLLGSGFVCGLVVRLVVQAVKVLGTAHSFMPITDLVLYQLQLNVGGCGSGYTGGSRPGVSRTT